MNTLYIEENWDDTAIDTTIETTDYTLTDIEKLCFKCPMEDCKENSNKCLIKIAKKKGIAVALKTV